MEKHLIHFFWKVNWTTFVPSHLLETGSMVYFFKILYGRYCTLRRLQNMVENVNDLCYKYKRVTGSSVNWWWNCKDVQTYWKAILLCYLCWSWILDPLVKVSKGWTKFLGSKYINCRENFIGQVKSKAFEQMIECKIFW